MNNLPADFFQQAEAWKNAQPEDQRLLAELAGDITREKSKILGELYKRVKMLDGQTTNLEMIRQMLVDVVGEYEGRNRLYRVDKIEVYSSEEGIRTIVNVVRRLAS